MENKIAGNIAAVKYNPVTVVKKNESSHPSSDRKLTDDLKKKVKEKQLDMQNMLKFPGCSFILVLSDEVGESTKSCDCVLCFQSVQRTDLDGMIQHCKSKEHLLKVMELLNPHCADIYSKNGTEHEILSILNCRSGDLDKDGVSFAPLSTFLSVRKNINTSVSSSPKNIGDNDCVKGVKDSSIVEGAKGSKIISLKRKSCYDNQTSPHKPEKEICTPPKNIKLAAESVTNKGTVNKDSKDATETQKLKVKIERIKDTANKKQNESSQPGSNPKVTHDDEGKKLEEKKKEIRKMLNIPGHSFILVLSDKIDEEKEVYDCVLCYQYSQRTNLEGIIQHCKSRNHLLKVLDLVNRKCAAFYSNKGTEFQIISVLKSRASELDKDGVTFAPYSTFFSVRVAIFKRILGLLKNPIKDKEDWTNIIPRESLTPIKSPESEPTHPCLSSKSLSSAKDIESNANVTALSKSKPLSKNMPLVKSESSIPKSKIAVKNSAANSELEKSNGTMPKCEKIVGNEDPKDAILNLKKKNMKISSLPNTKSLDSSQSNISAMKSKTSTNIGDAKCSPATVVKKNESSQPYFDPKVTDDIKGKTFEEKKLEIQKVLHSPGHSFILVLSEKIDEDKKAYDCVLCHKNTQRTSLEGIIQHCKSKDHMLKSHGIG
ncbi:hypothetical protein Avbf_03209 [Armadillidium vulgare]|nr:hypothetical protein Avbf_03209 [Armadillidium vulgare]